MGTFLGHVLPGSFFISFAIWWTTQITRRYLTSRRDKQPFGNLVYQPLQCGRRRCCQEWPAESVIKVLLPIVGVVGEVLASRGWSASGHVLYSGDLQHATMYGFFILSGLVDILTYYRLVPQGTDYCAATLAFAAEGLLFSFHLHGRSALDVHVHTLLLYVIYCCVAASLLEMRFRRTILAGLVRTYFVFLQGTWFWHVAFLLHNPFPVTHKPSGNLSHDEQEKKEHMQQMMMTLAFTWHLGGVLLVMAAIAGVTRACFVCCHHSEAAKLTGSSAECENLLSNNGSDIETEQILFEKAMNISNGNVSYLGEGNLGSESNTNPPVMSHDV